MTRPAPRAPAIPERPEIVFFDLGDTLVRAEPSWTDIYQSVFREHRLEVDRDALLRALHEATLAADWELEGPFEATQEASMALVRRFDEDILRRLGHELAEELFVSIETAFASRSAWHIYPDSVPALEALAEAGIRRGVISNWVWGAPELLHDMELAAHFEALVISARIGYNKPATQIFQAALELTGVAPERAVHVGDSYRNDVLGARRAGISPVLIERPSADPARRRAQLPEGDEVPVVKDLIELVALLGLSVDRVQPLRA